MNKSACSAVICQHSGREQKHDIIFHIIFIYCKKLNFLVNKWKEITTRKKQKGITIERKRKKNG